MMEVPNNLLFTEDHEWVRDEGDGVVRVGITHFAQDALGDIVYYEAPAVGAQMEPGDEMAVVESVKAVSDVYAPVAGEVLEVNEAAVDSPELINSSPYDDGWLVVLRLDDVTVLDSLLTPDAYAAHIEQD